MGRVINGTQMEKTPVVQIKEKEGTTFVGTKTGQKPGKQPGSFIFEFKIEAGSTADTALATGNKIIKNGKSVNEYASVPVKLHDKVCIFGDTQLNDKLAQTVIGDKVKVVYNGLKLNEKTGRAFNDYHVEII